MTMPDRYRVRPMPQSHGTLPRPAAWRSILQVIAIVVASGLSAFAGGFLVFADHVASAHAPERPRADGIVAVTGGAQRIEDAAALLGRGVAARLLISGVHEATTAGALALRSPQLARLLRCCVDIGRQAQDTRGNAREAREWVRRRGYDSLIVVTSAYHMPRTLTEIRRVMPEVRLVPYPVNPDGRDYARWLRDPEVFRLLGLEYGKYVVARLG